MRRRPEHTARSSGGRTDWNAKHDDETGLLRNSWRFQKLHGRRDEIGFPQGGDAMSSRPQPRQYGSRNSVQGTERSLSSVVGFAETGGLRSLRSCRLRTWRFRNRRRWFRGVDGGYFRRPFRRCDGRAARRRTQGPRARLGSPLQFGNFARTSVSRQNRID